MDNWIVKVGVYSEYSKPQDMWEFTVWAQTDSGERFHLMDCSPTFRAAQDSAEFLLGTCMKPNKWEKVSG